jgi:hypothetical protein
MFRWRLGRDPMWSEFDRMQRHLDELARRMEGGTRSPFEYGWNSRAIFPALNVTKEDKTYVVTAEIPGIELEAMRTRYTVIQEIYVAFEDGGEVWFLDSAYTRNDYILIGTENEVTANICARHGFAALPLDWELIPIPDAGAFKKWFGIE